MGACPPSTSETNSKEFGGAILVDLRVIVSILYGGANPLARGYTSSTADKAAAACQRNSMRSGVDDQARNSLMASLH
jgi:hypothetical protein